MSERRIQDVAAQIADLERRVRVLEMEREAEAEKRRKLSEKMEAEWRRNTVA